MAGARYELQLKARIDKDTSMLAMDLKRELLALEKKGATDIKISLKADKEGMKRYEILAKDAFGNSKKYVGEYVAETKKAEASIKNYNVEVHKAEKSVGALQEASVRYKNSLNELIKTQQIEKTLESDLSSLRSSGIDDISVKKKYDDALGEVTRATVKYTDETGKAISTTYSYGKSLDGTTPELKKITDQTEKSGKSTNYFTQSMLQSIKSAAQYALSIGLIYKALQQLGNGVEYIKALDKEMRNIQIVAGYTDETIGGLATQYNSLAKEMGATTLEVATGSLEWIRQGKSIEETQELLQSTLMLSKLGAVDTASATEYLTSILNGFKLEAEDSVAVVDKLVAIDNAAATSVEEMAIAFQKSAVSAQAAGVDLETLAAYVGTVSSVTRLSAETVGTSFWV